jgi:hypothetical protein
MISLTMDIDTHRDLLILIQPYGLALSACYLRLGHGRDPPIARLNQIAIILCST